MSSAAIQLLNGLASASTLFLVAAGLSLIFGVTRIVNFAHGSLFMLGIYAAYSLVGVLGFWSGVLAAALAVGAFGAAAEVAVLRRLYAAPEILQLLATFALALIVKDFALWFWGAQDLLGPRAPHLGGSVQILGAPFPQYDLLLIAVGPAVMAALWLLLRRTRWGALVRAATDPERRSAVDGREGPHGRGGIGIGEGLQERKDFDSRVRQCKQAGIELLDFAEIGNQRQEMLA